LVDGTQYFITIDRLDENWVDDILRHKLIRALIEAIKSFRKVHHLKVIIALRTDLLERVYRLTRDAGFQEEKYDDLNARIRWTDEELRDLVNKRISASVKRLYSRSDVKFSDLFPKTLNEKETFDYLLQRTLRRPRDIIAFVNHILTAASGRTDITKKIILNGEATYSLARKKALIFEWQSDYPSLEVMFRVLEKGKSRFTLSEINDVRLEELALALVQRHVASGVSDHASRISASLFNAAETYKLENLRDEVVKVLYKVGAIGIKAASHQQPQFSEDGPATLSDNDISGDMRILVHPMLWRGLGVFKDRLGGQIVDDE
jgi:hypothetical protein